MAKGNDNETSGSEVAAGHAAPAIDDREERAAQQSHAAVLQGMLTSAFSSVGEIARRHAAHAKPVSREAGVETLKPLPAVPALRQGGELSFAATIHEQCVTLVPGEGAAELWIEARPATVSAALSLEVSISSNESVNIPEHVFDVKGVQAGERSQPTQLVFHVQLTGGRNCRLMRLAEGHPHLNVAIRRVAGELSLLRFALTSAEPRDVLPASDESPSFSPAELERKLWGGYSRYALPELERTASDEGARVGDRVAAAWYLIRWYFVSGDLDSALRCVELVRQLQSQIGHRFVLAEVEIYIASGQYEAASAALKRALQEFGSSTDLKLLNSTVVRHIGIAEGKSLPTVERDQLSALNEVFVAAGLAALEKDRPDRPLSLANLVAHPQPRHASCDAKVSVVLPACNAEETVGWALLSLLRQTWSNLEVIVVDDGSHDGTLAIVNRIAEQDDRVRVIRMASNVGSYAARNAGARQASGEYVTVHDADDWSHPQRIELQMDALRASPHAIAVESHCVRTGMSLETGTAWLPRGTLFQVNYTSLMFRRELLDRIGLWDEVRVSGDGEFSARLRSVYGQGAVLRMPRQCLLALALTRPGSLTQSQATHVRTLFHGVRWNYRDAYKAWHKRLVRGDLRGLPFRQAERPFPVPVGNVPGRAQDFALQVLVVADFADPGAHRASALDYVRAASSCRERVGILHWRHYCRQGRTPLRAETYEMCQQHGASIVNPGDVVSTDIVLVVDADLLRYQMDPRPVIDASVVIVIDDDAGHENTAPTGIDAHSDLIDQHVRDAFRGRCVRVSSCSKPESDVWYPVVASIERAGREQRWRRPDRVTPVLGRHCIDGARKWPREAGTILNCWGGKEVWDVRFMGGADHAVRVLGYHPANWTVWPADSMGIDAFLDGLDFLVDFRREGEPVRAFRTVLEAMAAGVPVILPPAAEHLFGDAAVYASGDRVAPVIESIWQSESRYLSQVNSGLKFVRRHCSVDSFARRIAGVEA